MQLLAKIGEEKFKLVVKELYDARLVALSKDPNNVNYGDIHSISISDTEKLSFSAVPVSDEDVSKFASSKCKTCWGKGLVVIRPAQNINKIDISSGSLPDTGVGSFGTPVLSVCHCAQKRYLNKNTDIYIDPVKMAGWMKITWKIDTIDDSSAVSSVIVDTESSASEIK